MAEVVEHCLERVRRRRNDIEFDVHVVPWQVYGDAAGLNRAVLNLLDNAAKWSPSGGRVGLRLSQLDATHGELVVSDHGPGIPLQERGLVFERFFRSTSARAMPGSGLGLAIVKQVVLKHGGALRVDDTVPNGQPPGTSIYVLLPGRPAPAGLFTDESYPVGAENSPQNGNAAHLTEPATARLSGFSVGEGKVVVNDVNHPEGRVT
jgi:two-component system sensor histidine kinase MprB